MAASKSATLPSLQLSGMAYPPEGPRPSRNSQTVLTTCLLKECKPATAMPPQTPRNHTPASRTSNLHTMSRAQSTCLGTKNASRSPISPPRPRTPLSSSTSSVPAQPPWSNASPTFPPTRPPTMQNSKPSSNPSTPNSLTTPQTHQNATL